MRNKLISFILLSFLVILPLPSVVEEKLEVTTSVPEDFGIVFPSDALHIDRLYFAFKSSDGYSYLTENMPLKADVRRCNQWRHKRPLSCRLRQSRPKAGNSAAGLWTERALSAQRGAAML